MKNERDTQSPGSAQVLPFPRPGAKHVPQGKGMIPASGGRPPMPLQKYYSQRPIIIDEDEEKSLALAETQDFLGMASIGLWGDEAALYQKEYGEMLRGLVEQFLPRNTWELQLLSTDSAKG